MHFLKVSLILSSSHDKFKSCANEFGEKINVQGN